MPQGDDARVLAGIIRSELERGVVSGTALAKACDVAPQTVSKWRSGQTAPEPFRFPAIEAALRLPAGTLRAAVGLAPEDAAPLLERIEALEGEISGLRRLLGEVARAVIEARPRMEYSAELRIAAHGGDAANLQPTTPRRTTRQRVSSFEPESET